MIHVCGVNTSLGKRLVTFQGQGRTSMGLFVIGMFASAMAASPALGAPGDLDLTFGGTGIVRTQARAAGNQFSEATAVAIQADQKIVAAGSEGNNVGPPNNTDFAVVRYNTDGSLDTTFDGDGIVRTNPSDPAATDPRSDVEGIAIQADGKIVVVGGTDDANDNVVMAVVRYNPDGTLDTSFGPAGTGIVRTDASDPAATNPRSDADDVAIQADGKIVVVGDAEDVNGNTVIAVVRYNPDGSLDSTFDGDGIVRTDASDPAALDPDSDAEGVVIQSDGKIVVAAEGDDANNIEVVAVVRYNPDGSLDTTFDGDGIVRTDASDPASANPESEGNDVAIQADGKIVVAAEGNDANDNEVVAVVRYNPDGSLDTTFDGDGIVRTDASDPAAANPGSDGEGVVIQADQKIVVAGDAKDSNDERAFAVVQYNTDGSLNTGFGPAGTGIVVTQTADPSITDGESIGSALALQADEKLVVAGRAFGVDPETEFALARYLNDTLEVSCLGAAPTTGCKVNGVSNQACVGTDGPDKIIGTNGADVIAGLAGNDLIAGLRGADKICGDAGHDEILGNRGADEISGGDGNDVILGGFGSDKLDGNPGDDQLFGNPQNDILDGGPGFDFLNGGLGKDTCVNGEIKVFCK